MRRVFFHMAIFGGVIMSDDEDQEYYDYILENCCTQCSNILDCDGPDNPLPDGVCETGEVDDEDEDGGDYE